MYEYIKGKKIELEEHMLSASEIASLYNIFTVDGKHPHGLMISAILRKQTLMLQSITIHIKTEY